MITVRAFYKKTGRLKYISHLDMNRCMQRAIKMAGLPVWYTEGFNPHAYVTFAAPLSLGFESLCESMDFRLVEDMKFDEVAKRLNAHLPQGLEIVRVAFPQSKPDKIVSADYTAELVAPGADTLADAFMAFVQQAEIVCEKRSKKGVSMTDIRPMILQTDAKAGEADTLCLQLRLAAGNTVNLNPNVLITAFSNSCGVHFNPVRVCKTAIYEEDGKEFC